MTVRKERENDTEREGGEWFKILIHKTNLKWETAG